MWLRELVGDMEKKRTCEQLRRAFPNGRLDGDWYKLSCPVCGGDKCAVRIEGSHIGGVSCFHKPGGQDHNSEATALIYEAMDGATISRPIAAAPAPTANSGWGYSESQLRKAEANIEQAAEFLAGRGISMEVAKRLRFGVDDDRIVMPTFYEGELVNVKMRQLVVLSKATKWRKHNRDKGTHVLFNRETLHDGGWGEPLWVVESQLDAAMLISHNKRAVSVEDAGHKLNEQDKEAIRNWAGRILFAPDSDGQGTACMLRFAEELGIEDAECVRPPCKDLGELYADAPANFDEQLAALASTPTPLWRATFRSVIELEQGDTRQYIKGGMVMEGSNFNAAPSGVCKTWVQLCEAKALTSGKPLFGYAPFSVPERQHVIYLIPEATERAFRKRLEKVGIEQHGEWFLCRTMKQGILRLDDPALLAAIKAWRPIVFLDTYIRFMPHEADENSAGDNSRGLAEMTFNLMRIGAGAVVAAHHAPKSITAANDKGRYVTKDMTLENMLRGSGDIGAMSDSAIGFRHADSEDDSGYLKESKDLTRIYVHPLKPREGISPDDFIIQGRPYLDTFGDFRVLTEAEESSADLLKRAARLLEEQKELRTSKRQLGQALGVGGNRLLDRGNPPGWRWNVITKTSGEFVREAILQ